MSSSKIEVKKMKFPFLLLVLLASVAASEIAVNFNTVGPLRSQESNRFFVNVSCIGESSEFLAGDLVEYQISLASGNYTKLLRDSKFVFSVPCPSQQNMVFTDMVPSNYQGIYSLNGSLFYGDIPIRNITITYQARRFDMPVNLIPISYSHTFDVLSPVQVLSQNETQPLIVQNLPAQQIQFGFNLFWFAVAAFAIGIIVLFFRKQLGFIFIIAAIVMVLISWYFKI